jgi:hypothetical protein
MIMKSTISMRFQPSIFPKMTAKAHTVITGSKWLRDPAAMGAEPILTSKLEPPAVPEELAVLQAPPELPMTVACVRVGGGGA